MSYTFYKLLHFISVFMVLISLGAIYSHMLQGGTKKNFKNRRFFALVHGFGMLISLIAGFGLIAKMGFAFTSVWIYVKLAGWLAFGLFPLVFYKQKKSSKIPFVALMGVLVIMIYFAAYKPF